jgi:long-chain acyl-CoA synthetase
MSDSSGLASSWPTVPQLLRRAARLWAAREAAVDGGRREDFATLHSRSCRLASGLLASGLKKGARVAFIGDNSLEYLECYFGVPSAEMVLLPLNSRLAGDELSYILEDSGSSLVIVGRGYEEVVQEAAEGLDVELISAGVDSPPRGWARYDSLLAEGRDDFISHGRPDEVAYLYYTSGTTGRPKGCMLTHLSVIAGSLSACAMLGLRGEHTWLHAGPMYHLGDAWAIWGLAMLGGRQVMMRFAPEQTAEIIVEERVTHTLLVPTALDMLSEAAVARRTRFSDTQAIIYGGAPMPPQLLSKLRDRLDAPLIHTYGITETSGVCTGLHAAEHEDPVTGQDRSESIGRETPLIDIDIVDDAGSLVAPGDVGEIRVTSPAVMYGYLGKPAETAAVLTGSSYLTGDMARRDEDGYLWLTDRKKDMIISGGENVYAMEVERVLGQHPSVGEVAVVGVAEEHWGERVCAVVQLATGHTLTLVELQEMARQSLAGYKIPREMIIVDSLPRTGTGKIDKRRVREHARAEAIAHDLRTDGRLEPPRSGS